MEKIPEITPAPASTPRVRFICDAAVLPFPMFVHRPRAGQVVEPDSQAPPDPEKVPD